MKEKAKKEETPLLLSDTVEETLSEVDRGMVENARMKRELALSNVKNALSQSENAELSYNNMILQLALKYKLTEGDIISENGQIQRGK